MSHLKIGDISCSQEANMYLLLSSICAVTEHINNDKQTTKIIQLDRGSERLWPHNKTVNTNRQTHTLSSSQLLCNSVSRSPAVWTHTLSCDPLFSVMAGNDCLRYRSNTFRTSSEPETQEYSNEQSLAFQTLSQSHIRRVIQRSCDRITVRRNFLWNDVGCYLGRSELSEHSTTSDASTVHRLITKTTWLLPHNIF